MSNAWAALVDALDRFGAFLFKFDVWHIVLGVVVVVFLLGYAETDRDHPWHR